MKRLLDAYIYIYVLDGKNWNEISIEHVIEL